MYFNYARIAAGIAVVAAAGFFIREEVRKAYPAETEDTFSDPRMALEETKKALMMISNSFNKAHKEAAKIEMFNEAEQKIQGKQVDQKKVNI
jgi:lipase chaperone LimK